jgi:hypothetical protein
MEQSGLECFSRIGKIYPIAPSQASKLEPEKMSVSSVQSSGRDGFVETSTVHETRPELHESPPPARGLENSIVNVSSILVHDTTTGGKLVSGTMQDGAHKV